MLKKHSSRPLTSTLLLCVHPLTVQNSNRGGHFMLKLAIATNVMNNKLVHSDHEKDFFNIFINHIFKITKKYQFSL